MATDKALFLRARERRDKITGEAYSVYTQAVEEALVRFDKRRSAATCTEHFAATALTLGSDVEMARIDYRKVQDEAWAVYRKVRGW